MNPTTFTHADTNDRERTPITENIEASGGDIAATEAPPSYSEAVLDPPSYHQATATAANRWMID